jgi:hypothetical protein
MVAQAVLASPMAAAAAAVARRKLALSAAQAAQAAQGAALLSPTFRGKSWQRTRRDAT